MVGANNDETRFHPSSDRNPMSDKVSEMAMSSLSSYKSANGSDQYYTSGWDPLVSLSQNQNFAGSSMTSHHPEFASSHIVRYPSGSSFGELVPKLPCFGNGGFSEMVGSFGQPQDDHQLSEGVSVDASPDGKRRKRNLEPDSTFGPNKNGEGELHIEISGESTEVPREPDEKKQKTEQINGANLRGKQAGKQSKDNSNSGDGGKNDYIHVRARRGQATNSHSLAERVRREKISERMRLLQDLVPGCNKITGKAVMLDEIINYVQSLQQQVEFLSMKLATVNPESNIDLERIMPKDILGFGPGMGSSQPYPHGAFPGPMQGLPSAALQFPPVPQSALDTELHNLFQMGFNPGSTIDNLGQNGRLKSEL